MSSLRTIAGATMGAAVAAFALRLRVVARERNASILDTLVDVRSIVADDAALVADAARGAFEDGKAARARAEREVEQVARSGRRTKDQHD